MDMLGFRAAEACCHSRSPSARARPSGPWRAFIAATTAGAIVSCGGFTCLFKHFFVVAKNSGGILESATAMPGSEFWLFFLPLCPVRITYTVWGPLSSGSMGTGLDWLSATVDARAPGHVLTMCWALCLRQGLLSEGGGSWAGEAHCGVTSQGQKHRAGRCCGSSGHRASRQQGRRNQVWSQMENTAWSPWRGGHRSMGPGPGLQCILHSAHICLSMWCVWDPGSSER